MDREKVIIIGGGITGTTIARELSRYCVDIILLEKEPDVACGTTKANSGILHAGYDDDPERYPVRASLCSKGNRLWHNLAEELDIPVRWIGSFVVARKEEQLDVLDEIYIRGGKNNVPSMKILDKEEAQQMEPNLPSLLGALWAPTEGVTVPYEAAIALAENAIENGVSIRLNTEVQGIETRKDGIKAITNRGEFKADWLINAAGLYGDKISRMAGINKSNQGVDLRIHPRKGEYFVFERECGCPVNHIIFPTPTPISKGILIWPAPEGNTLIGPNAQDLPEDKKEDKSTTSQGLNEVYEKASELVPSLPPRNRCIKNFAGLRAELSHADFILEDYEKLPGFINVIGIRSPGLAAALAIAKKIVELMKEQGFTPKEREKFNPYRKRIPRINELPPEERGKLIRKDKRYAHVICWCEGITEGEIVEAINRGARTFQGVSFRTRAGMGRCQGESCLPRIVSIMSRELKIPKEEILLKGKEDHLSIGRLKEKQWRS
jgi:glycerol-3-phosphate dehydrogenase